MRENYSSGRTLYLLPTLLLYYNNTLFASLQYTYFMGLWENTQYHIFATPEIN